MNPQQSEKTAPSGIGVALAAALLFGASTPLAKILLGHIEPVLLAALLYIGSGIGLSILRKVKKRGASDEAVLTRAQWPWLAGAVLFGGILGPVLLMLGLTRITAASASLLLNLEGVATALIAWFVFHENFDRRIALGMATIVLGGIALNWQPGAGIALANGTFLVASACLCWGIDNNLTQKVSSSDPFQIAAIKGLVAGSANLVIAFSLGAHIPPLPVLSGALLIGFFGYGLSLSFFVLALRSIGTARTGAYFSLAPFIGTTLALVFLREPANIAFLPAAALMALGTWLHLSERHEHLHHHEPLKHSHRHVHDAHHQHEHPPGTDPSEPHSHEHLHTPLSHSHKHYPDIHHRHLHPH